MADDLVISLSADTQNFLRDMKASADGMKKMGEEAEKTNSLLGKIKWSFAANSLGVMIQDMTTVASMGGGLNQILNAGANNAIQLATQLHPAAGAITAAAIAGYQLYSVLSGSAAEAKKLKEEADAFSKNVINFGKSGDASELAKEARGLQAEWGQLENRIKSADNAVNRLQAKRDDLVRKNTSILKTQMNNPEILAEIKSLENLRDNVIAERKKLATQRDANMAAQEIIAPDARQAIAQDAITQQRKKTKEANDADLKERQEIAEVIRQANRETDEANKRRQDERNGYLQILREEADLQRRLGQEKDARAKSLRDSLGSPQQKLQERGKELMSLGDRLSDDEKRKLLMRDAMAAMQGGPQLSAGLVKGSIEEESFRNRKEAENRNQQFIRAMVDKVIQALKPQPVAMPGTVG